MNNNLIIVSHRRSGTHLTIDSIRNNFAPFKANPFITLHDFCALEYNKIEEMLKKEYVVIKTHMLPYAEMYTSDPGEQAFLTDLFKSTKKIYVYRDVRDVLVSAYYYKNAHKKNIPFSEFIRKEKNIGNTTSNMSRPAFWKFHMDSWTSQNFEDILFIRYEDLMKDYYGTLNKISDFIGLKTNSTIVDVTIKKEKNILLEKVKKIIGIGRVLRTSVRMRKGVIGDYKNHFSEDDEAYLDKILGSQESLH